MTFLTTLGIAVGLSMDSFAVSISKGLTTKRNKLKNALKFAFTVCIFHVVMICLGYYAGSNLKEFISNVDHWIAFILLGVVGGKMIYEAFGNHDEGGVPSLNLKTLLLLGLATSIDALVVGGSFAFLNTEIIKPLIIIGLTVPIFSLFGFYLGEKVGLVVGNKAEIVGGLILIGIGAKTLIEHLL